MKPKLPHCDECEKHWAAYAAAIIRSIDVGRAAPVDEQRQKTADLAWENARRAVEEHIATHTGSRKTE